MRSDMFPRTMVGGLSLSRMIMGTNWLLGWSHRGPAADHMIKTRHSAKESICPILEAYLEHGVDTIMAPFNWAPRLVEAIKETERKTGKHIIMIDTPVINVDDTPEARREAEAVIRRGADLGAEISLIHHASCEQLVNKNKRTIARLDDYTGMIRDAGMIPGLSAHMPEMVTFSDDNGYDVEAYLQIYNCLGFLMQVEVETVARIINEAKNPVMTIKPMAAGRCTPYVGLNFVWNTIRSRDMVTVGAFTPEEVHEDVEISLAALERRYPRIEKRSSPVKDQTAFGNI
jgi:hypothetical protein